MPAPAAGLEESAREDAIEKRSVGGCQTCIKLGPLRVRHDGTNMCVFSTETYQGSVFHPCCAHEHAAGDGAGDSCNCSARWGYATRSLA